MEPPQETQDLINTLSLQTAQMKSQAAQFELQAAQTGHQQRMFELLRAQTEMRPSSVYIPVLFHDGLQWVAWYGGVSEEVQKMLPEDVTTPGVKAMGDSPAQALVNFDSHWLGLENKDDPKRSSSDD